MSVQCGGLMPLQFVIEKMFSGRVKRYSWNRVARTKVRLFVAAHGNLTA
jgi:hypothetical protein